MLCWAALSLLNYVLCWAALIELRLIYKEANGKVKRAVATDANAFAQKQVEVVERL
jgi:hypothetical protein